MNTPRVAPGVAAVWDRAWTAPWAWTLIVAFNIALGLSYLLGGPTRISSPSFAALRIVGSETSGLVFLTAALGCAVAPFVGARTLRASFWLLACLHLLLAAGFLIAVLNEPPLPPYPPPPPFELWPQPATSGPWTYLFIVGAHAINAAAFGPRGPLAAAPTTPEQTPGQTGSTTSPSQGGARG